MGDGDEKVVARRVMKKKDAAAVWDQLVENRKSKLKTLTYFENFMLVTAGAATVALVTVVGLHVTRP